MMLYRLYLYGTDATTVSAPAIRIINQTLASGFVKDWEEDDVAALLKPFDIMDYETFAAKAAFHKNKGLRQGEKRD